MAIIKSYTDIEQSRKLAQILPLESADMWYEDNGLMIPRLGHIPKEHTNTEAPCWSLAALLDIVKTYSSRLEITIRADKNYNIFAVSGDFVFHSFDDFPDGFDNLVDACVDIIERLHELNSM